MLRPTQSMVVAPARIKIPIKNGALRDGLLSVIQPVKGAATNSAAP